MSVLSHRQTSHGRQMSLLRRKISSLHDQQSVTRGHDRPRGRGRRRVPTPSGSRKRSDADTAAAQAENVIFKKHKHGELYARRQQLIRMDIVQDLMDNDGTQFLKDVDPANPEPGWELDKNLNLDAIEEDQHKFFDLLTLFLGGLKHHKLKNPDGTMMPCLHEKIKRHSTAINNLWRKAHRPIPFTYQSLMSEYLSNKRKKEKNKR